MRLTASEESTNEGAGTFACSGDGTIDATERFGGVAVGAPAASDARADGGAGVASGTYVWGSAFELSDSKVSVSRTVARLCAAAKGWPPEPGAWSKVTVPAACRRCETDSEFALGRSSAKVSSAGFPA